MIIYIVTIIYSCSFARAYWTPENPCPGLLSYESSAGRTNGIITVNNDYSGNYVIAVNASIPFTSNTRMSLEMANYNEIQRGVVRELKYRLKFASNEAFPKVTLVVFNGRQLCSSQPYPVSTTGVTNMWAQYRLTSSLQASGDPLGGFEMFPETSTWFIPQTTRWTTPRPTRPWTTRWTRPPITTQWTTPLSTTRWRTTTRSQAPPTITNRRKPLDTECGIAQESVPLVIGGEAVREGEVPWLTALFYYNKFDKKYNYRCTGSLVSERHVITAGHCLQYEKAPLHDKENLLLVFGKSNLDNWARGGILGYVEAVNVHPKYVQGSGGHDVAILKMSNKVRFTVAIRPICLWQGDSGLSRLIASGGSVAGWGKSNEGELYSSMPNKIHVPVVSQETCLRSHPAFRMSTTADTFCGGARNHTGPCTGDSGSGFYVYFNGRYFLRGIVSYAVAANKVECDLKNYVVFADVAKESQWINGILNDI